MYLSVIRPLQFYRAAPPNHVYSDSVSFVLIPIHIWKNKRIVTPKRKPRIMR
jgi:hypothetical protein